MEEKEGLLRENRELRQRLNHVEELLAQRQKAERDLKDEYDFTSEWLNTAGALLLVLDQEGHIVRFNQACEKATGYNFTEVKNKPFWDIFLTPEEKDGVIAIFNRLISGGLTITHDNYWVTKEGNLRLVAWSLTVLVKDGQAKFVIKSGIDVSERAHTEKFIAHLASFPQLNPDPILEIDLSGKITFYNAATLKTLENLGLPGLIETFFPPDLKEIFQEAKQTGKSYFQREVYVGDSVFAEAISFPAGLNVARIYASDITGRKRAEELLRQSEEKLARAEEVALLGHWDLDLKSNKLTWSNELFRLFGQDPATFVPTVDAFVDAIHSEDREKLIAIRNTALREATGFTVDYRIVVPDRPERFIQEKVKIIRDEAGNPIRTFGTAHDITERKLLEERFLRAQKMETVGRLAGGVAHDFNNVLTAIMGNSEILLMGLRRDDPLYDNAQGILDAAERAAALTRQLLAVSRKQVLQSQVLNLNAVIKNILNMLKRLIREEIELVTVLDPDLGNVKADQGQIEQVILNLVLNARDAIPQRGKLTITTANAKFLTPLNCQFDVLSPGRYAVLSVSDTGMGLDPEIQEQIFEPFYTTKEMGKGTGLGLATVYGIVKQSEGYIDVISQAGLGTTFTVYLPQVEDIVSSREEAKASQPLQVSETILIVDDSDMVRIVIANALEMHGYKVLTASSGDEALLLSERHQGPIHLMLTDVVMPKMCGRELVKQLAPLRPEMKVLYMSAYPEDIIGPRGVLDKDIHFIQKPYKLEVLLQKMRQMLDSSKNIEPEG